MTRRSLQHLLKLSALTSAATARPLRARHAPVTHRRSSGDKAASIAAAATMMTTTIVADLTRLVQLPTGQFVTPTAIEDAVQQFLNPGLPAYPNFVAGEAVRSQLSPDGTTLAILTAGQNSLYKPDGTVDVANSTQFIFLYDVSGANKAQPVLTQVIKQVNAHVGLVFSPDGNTLYAAGGNDDAVYVYTKSGGASRPRRRSRWTTSRPAPPAARATRASASACSPTPAAWASPPTARRWSSPTTTTTRSA